MNVEHKPESESVLEYQYKLLAHQKEGPKNQFASR